jgi:hypothetical protein
MDYHPDEDDLADDATHDIITWICNSTLNAKLTDIAAGDEQGWGAEDLAAWVHDLLYEPPSSLDVTYADARTLPALRTRFTYDVFQTIDWDQVCASLNEGRTP